MGINYRKRIKLLPGVTLNISKRGISTTVGRKGMSVNLGSKGAYLNTGIPGTGLYSRKKISGTGGGSSAYHSSTPVGQGNPPRQSTGCFWLNGGCWSMIALVIGVIFIVFSLSMIATGEEGSLYTGLTFGIVLTLPFLYSKLRRRTSATQGEGSLYLKVLGSIFLCAGLLLLGVGLDSRGEADINASFFMGIGGVMLAVGFVMLLIALSKGGSKAASPEAEASPTEPGERKIVIYDLDPLFIAAARSVVERQEVSTDIVQHEMELERGRAGRIVNQLEQAGIVGALRSGKPREVLCKDAGQLDEILKRIESGGVSTSDWSAIPDSLFQEIVSAVNKLFAFLQTLARNNNVLGAIEIEDASNGGTLSGTDRFTIDTRIALTSHVDLITVYKSLGYDVKRNSRESVALTLFTCKLIRKGWSRGQLTQETLRGGLWEAAHGLVEATQECLTYQGPDSVLILAETLKKADVDKRLPLRYLTLIYDLTSLLAQVDGKVSFEESAFMSKIWQEMSELSGKKTEKRTTASPGKPKTLKAERELKKLIGLTSVKEEVARMTNFVKVQQMRKEKGMATSPISYHCVFTGNPGTGKTTVARLLAAIYKDLGVLTKGHLVETDRSGLVAEYVGQTAVKTNKIIDSALGGVLFIDEAYSLVQGGSQDYGSEAIATLLKRMEDDRDKLVVILAGYGDEMKRFIDSNPGLQSRFNRYIHFPDYSAEELMSIAKLELKKLEYELADGAEQTLAALFNQAVLHKDKNFGNGRFARNTVERMLENQATRLSSMPEITDDDLRQIVVTDIPS